MTLGEASNENGSRAGEDQVIVGESGVGKTSVLRAIAHERASAEAGGTRPEIANEEDFDANE